LSNDRRQPATAEQSRLWLLQQRTPDSTAYNVPIILNLANGVRTQALADAVDRLVARHPALRMAFESGPDGLYQVVAEHGTPCKVFAPGHFTQDTWRSFATLVFDTPFDLSTPTLFRAWLLPFADGSCRLLMNLHHIITDGWSMNLLFDDLTQLYEDAAQGRTTTDALPSLTTLEFAQWQRQWRVAPQYRDQRRALAELHRRQ
ncbi:condensation domain-containing protein, partial [Pseudomonas viridiflava]